MSERQRGGRQEFEEMQQWFAIRLERFRNDIIIIIKY